MHPACLVAVIVVLFNVVCAVPGIGSVSSPHFSLPVYLRPRALPLSNSSVPNSGISAVAITSDKQSYYTVIQVGAISFRVALDTASSDLWILSTACTTSTCKTVPRYPLAYESSTFSPVNSNSTVFNVSYADGTVANGFVAKESVQLANLTVPNQAFAVVSDSNVTLNDEVSGIMGLGFPRLSSISNTIVNATPYFSTLAQKGQLAYPVFGLSLTRNSTGSLSIGAVDTAVVKNISLVQWNTVVEFGPFGSESNTSSYLQWAIPLSGISVNGTSVTPSPTYPKAQGNSSIALFDIGTSGIYGPYQDVSRIYSLIDSARLVNVNSGQWAIPCDTAIPISFTFGQQNFTLQPTDYLIGPASGNPNLCLSWPRALPPSSDGIDWQMGTAFLRTVYSVFSYGINSKEPPMIGLYPLFNSTNFTESGDSVSSFFASASATVATTLPDFPLASPSYTTPPYAFNTSVTALANGIVTSQLATSTYRPVLVNSANISGLPTILPSPTVATFILTDGTVVVTSTSTAALPSITLGIPPGWSAGIALRAPMSMTLLSFVSLSLILGIATNLGL